MFFKRKEKAEVIPHRSAQSLLEAIEVVKGVTLPATIKIERKSPGYKPEVTYLRATDGTFHIPKERSYEELSLTLSSSLVKVNMTTTLTRTYPEPRIQFRMDFLNDYDFTYAYDTEVKLTVLDEMPTLLKSSELVEKLDRWEIGDIACINIQESIDSPTQLTQLHARARYGYGGDLFIKGTFLGVTSDTDGAHSLSFSNGTLYVGGREDPKSDNLFVTWTPTSGDVRTFRYIEKFDVSVAKPRIG